jgi:hypothetical protein
MRKEFLIARLGATLLLLVTLAPVSVRADFLLQFDNSFKGTAPASSSTPWISAWFQDVTPGTVKLTISNLSLTASESVDSIYFNFSPLLDSRSLTLDCFNHGGDVDRPFVSLGRDSFKADGSGRYDIMFSFTKGGTIWNRFTENDFISFDISGIPNLNSSDFEYPSAKPGQAGPFTAAAHISRIGRCLETGWISASVPIPITSVPEPSASLLLSFGLGLWIAHRLWKRTNLLRKQAPKLAPIKSRAETDSRRGRFDA